MDHYLHIILSRVLLETSWTFHVFFSIYSTYVVVSTKKSSGCSQSKDSCGIWVVVEVVVVVVVVVKFPESFKSSKSHSMNWKSQGIEMICCCKNIFVWFFFPITVHSHHLTIASNGIRSITKHLLIITLSCSRQCTTLLKQNLSITELFIHEKTMKLFFWSDLARRQI